MNCLGLKLLQDIVQRFFKCCRSLHCYLSDTCRNYVQRKGRHSVLYILYHSFAINKYVYRIILWRIVHNTLSRRATLWQIGNRCFVKSLLHFFCRFKERHSDKHYINYCCIVVYGVPVRAFLQCRDLHRW